jgi:hypothetical protein
VREFAAVIEEGEEEGPHRVAIWDLSQFRRLQGMEERSPSEDDVQQERRT